MNKDIDQTLGRGHIFLDHNGRPYMCRRWGQLNQLWLFYWHADGHWVSLRESSQQEAALLPNNLTVIEQDYYREVHDDWARQHGSTTIWGDSKGKEPELQDSPVKAFVKDGGHQRPLDVTAPLITITIEVGSNDDGFWYRVTHDPVTWNTGVATGAGSHIHVVQTLRGIFGAILAKLVAGERG